MQWQHVVVHILVRDDLEGSILHSEGRSERDGIPSKEKEGRRLSEMHEIIHMIEAESEFRT